MEEEILEKEQKIKEILKITKEIEKMSLTTGWKYVQNILNEHINSLKEKILTCSSQDCYQIENIKAEIKSCRNLLDIVSYAVNVKKQLEEEKNEQPIDKMI